MENKISGLSKLLLLAAAVLLIVSLFVPLWSIYLDAPQYPEGLKLEIWPNKIAGDVDIINGLNHYIGMKTLKTSDFIEFTVLPYIIGFFTLLFISASAMARKRWLYIAFTAFVLFGIIAMVDFWKWEHDYGHNLDPNAAIKVPGMAYQPPLIGFKQLLNFGAYSIPALGGWLFISSGLLVLIAVLKETNFFKRFKKKTPVAALLVISIMAFSSCANKGPVPVNFDKDACEFCKMGITDAHFMAELVTQKGRVYKFDDISCMKKYAESAEKGSIKNYYVGNVEKLNEFIDATSAWYITHDSYKSPMGGNTVAFATKEAALAQANKLSATVADWNQINQHQEKKEGSSHEGHDH